MCKKTIASSFDEQYIKDEATGCWNWRRSVNKRFGYGQMWDGKRYMRAHRFSWERSRGPIPDALSVLHRCDNRRCVNPDHLFLGTHAVNTQDMMSKGRGKNGTTKIRAEDVAKIREMYVDAPQALIATTFGISQTQVSRIVNRKRWANAGT
jgi:hypothetical protein